MAESIAYELSDSIGTLTIQREDRHNALGAEELAGLDAALDLIEQDAEIRVLIVTGEGSKTFCAGAALGDLNSGRITPDGFQRVMQRIAKLPMPTLARINGSVFGGGTELALSCDFRIGVEGTRLRVPAAAFGLCYPPAGIMRFVKTLSPGAARRMLVASETLDAQELHRIGFFDYLVAPATLDERVEELALHMAGLAPIAVRAMKELLTQAQSGTIDAGRADELVKLCNDSADLQEGLAAQREKRPPRFAGR